MLQDKLRTRRFKEAIFSTVRPGDVVIDLGTGTGILAIWAAQAGAKRVYAIEETDVAEAAQAVVQRNGLGEVVEVVRANSSEVRLAETADVLIAELVGHFLFEEGIVEYVADIRDAWLKKGGKVIPSSARVFLAPAELGSEFREVTFWRDCTDLDLSPIALIAANSVYVEEVPHEMLLSEPAQVFSVDFQTVEPQPFECRAVFHIEQGGNVDVLCGWFSLTLSDEVSISTAPGDAPTHWKQCIFPLERPYKVSPGQVVECELRIEPYAPGSRWRWGLSVRGERGRGEQHEFEITYGTDSRLLKERF